MIEKVKGYLMSRVYFIKIENKDVELASRAARKLLETLVAEENITLAEKVPVKTHFGQGGASGGREGKSRIQMGTKLLRKFLGQQRPGSSHQLLGVGILRAEA